MNWSFPTVISSSDSDDDTSNSSHILMEFYVNEFDLQNARRIRWERSRELMWMAADIAQGMKSAVKTWNVKCESDMSRVLKSKAHFKWCSFSTVVVVSLAWIMGMAFTAKFSPYAKKKRKGKRMIKPWNTTRRTVYPHEFSHLFTACWLLFPLFIALSFLLELFFIHSRLRAPLATLSRLNLHSRVCG